MASISFWIEVIRILRGKCYLSHFHPGEIDSQHTYCHPLIQFIILLLEIQLMMLTVYLMLRQNGHQFAGNFVKSIWWNGNLAEITFWFNLHWILKDSTDNDSSLVQVKAWHRTGKSHYLNVPPCLNVLMIQPFNDSICHAILFLPYHITLFFEFHTLKTYCQLYLSNKSSNIIMWDDVTLPRFSGAWSLEIN